MRGSSLHLLRRPLRSLALVLLLLTTTTTRFVDCSGDDDLTGGSSRDLLASMTTPANVSSTPPPLEAISTTTGFDLAEKEESNESMVTKETKESNRSAESKGSKSSQASIKKPGSRESKASTESNPSLETTTTASSGSSSSFALWHPSDLDNSNSNNNNLSLATSNAAQDPTYRQYCLAHRNSLANLFTIVLYTLVCIVGLFGNTLVIYVVLRYSKMQTVTNIYILNLAIADECFLIGIPFLLYTMRICSWQFGEFMCKAYMVSTSITQFTSSIFLLIMSADRFIAVCHPISSPRYRQLHIAKLVSGFAWLTSAVLMAPVILFASTVRQEDGVHHSCNIDWPEAHKTHSGTTFILYTFALGFATPLCFILCFYYLVIRKLHAVGIKHKSKEKRRSHRKVTRLVLTVITVYILCWLPHWISQLALIHSNPAQSDLTRVEIMIFLLLGCLVYSNSAVNPVLYAFLSDNFRKSFFKAFVCMAARKDLNAQLQLEPSIFTARKGQNKKRNKSGQRDVDGRAGSKANRRRNSKSATVPPSSSLQGRRDRREAAAEERRERGANHNSSSTTTSTTTSTMPEKGGGGATGFCTNGRLSLAKEETTLMLERVEDARSQGGDGDGGGAGFDETVVQTEL